MSFTSDINAFAEKSRLRAEQVRRGVAIKLFSAVIKDTPVLTGRLRANWQVSADYPKRSQTSSTQALSGTTLSTVIVSIDEHRDIIMTNNLPYAARIEYDGWSSVKAPLGMVRHNVARFEKLVKLEVKRSRR